MGTLHDLAAGRIEQPLEPPPRDSRFLTAYEIEHRQAYRDAIRAMRDPRTDESQMLGESVTDDMSDLLELLCGVDLDNYADYGHRLLLLSRKHKDRVAQDEADRVCETVPEGSL